jgi:MFS family permease
METIKRFLTPSYQGNIFKFYVYRILYNFMPFLPVWVIFLQEKHDLSLTQITLIDTAFWLTMAVTEIPTGAVADTLGRKLSQVIGMVMATGSVLMFAQAPSFLLLMVANSLWAVALTFVSGAELALFYDTFRALDREDSYPAHRGRLSAVVLTSIAVSSGLGGLIGQVSLIATFWVTLAVMLLATVFLLLLKEPPQELDPESGQKITYANTLRISWKAIRREPSLRWALLYSNLLPLMGAAVRITFIQPHVLAVGLPIAALGFVTMGLRAFQIMGSASSGRVVDKFGKWNWMALAAGITFAGLIALGGFNSLWGIFFFALSGFAVSATRPLVEGLILSRTPGAVRATILSVDSLIFRVMLAAVEPGVGVIADRYGLPTAFLLMGASFGVLILVVMLRWRRVNQIEE